MFGLFKKKSEKEKLEIKYKKLMEESYQLSHTNRTKSDAKRAEADEVMNKIKELSSKQ